MTSLAGEILSQQKIIVLNFSVSNSHDISLQFEGLQIFSIKKFVPCQYRHKFNIY